MNKITNDLIQLQELIEVKAHHQTIKPRNHLTQLNKSIEKMLGELPPDIRTLFEKLIKTSHTAVVPVYNDACSACGMNIPVSMKYDIKSAKTIEQCPNCSRILYSPPENLEMIASAERAKHLRHQTGIAKYSSAALMIFDLDAGNSEEAIGAICARLEAEGFVDDGAQIAEIALERESIISTAVDHGVAFPHARGVEGGGLTLALGKSAKGFHYDEDSDELTHLVFFIVIPTAASAFYLKLLAGLTEALQSEASRAKLIKAESDKKLWNALIQTTKKTIK
jgi:mannitol/fructose-specific phosphotransferase system IIA component (Ntr-type)